VIGFLPHGRSKFRTGGKIRATPFGPQIQAKLAGSGRIWCAPPSGSSLIEKDGALVGIDTYLAEMEKIAVVEGVDPLVL